VSHRRKVQRFAAARNAEHMTVADVSRSVCKRAHSLVPNDAVAALAHRAAEIDVGSLSRPGVYVLLWRGEVVYVGQSNNVLVRIGQHAVSIAFDRALFIELRRKDSRLITEAALIRRFNPRHCAAGPKNRAHRDAAVLRRLGITPDPDTTAQFIARQDARWTPEARKAAADNSSRRARRRAR
jgi:hypothetical protein